MPGAIELLSSAATIGLMVSVGYFVWRLFLLMKRRLLWRVRRKLILSYIFIGVVPALLIIAFFTARRVGDLDQRQRLPVPATATTTWSTTPGSRGQRRGGGDRRAILRPPRETVARVQRNASTASRQYRRLSIVFVPTADGGAAAGAGRRVEPCAPPPRPHAGLADGDRPARSSARSRRRRRNAAATSS